MAHILTVLDQRTVKVQEHSSRTLRWTLVGTFNPQTEILLRRTPGRGKHTPIAEHRVYRVSEQIDTHTYRARRIE